MSGALARWSRAFGRFWWEFLVGDTPELFVATLAIVGLAVALRHDRAAAVVALPATVIAVLAVSAWRGRRRPAPDPGHQPADPAGPGGRFPEGA